MLVFAESAPNRYLFGMGQQWVRVLIGERWNLTAFSDTIGIIHKNAENGGPFLRIQILSV
jgi:hypothetical protein